MNLADTLALGAAVGGFAGGFLGFLVPARGFAELLDNSQRGAFAGGYLGAIIGSYFGVAG